MQTRQDKRLVFKEQDNGNWSPRDPDLLPLGYFSQSRMPLTWVNPNGSETNRSAFLWSHSAFDYIRNFTVKGGSPPYLFYLTEPVAGVTLTTQAPSWNPNLSLWANITIDHLQFGSGTKVFEINCKDQNNTIITLEMTVTVDDSKFVFVQQDAVGGDGSFSLPYGTFQDVYTTSTSNTAHAGKIVVFRTGTYLVDNFDTANTALQMNNNKPSGWIPFENEIVTLNVQANIIIGEPTGGPFVDYYFGNVTYTGGDTTAANIKIFTGFGSHNRIVLDRPRFVDILSGTSGTDNEACLYFSDNGFSSHTNISVIDPYYENLIGSSNGVAFLDFYSVTNAAIVGGTAINCSNNYGLWIKSKNDQLMAAGFNMYDTTDQIANRLFSINQADAGLSDPVCVVQILGCKAYRPTDGLFADTTLMLGDSNQPWGTVYCDRLTIVGTVRDNADDAPILGNATLHSCVVVNDLSTKIPTFVTSVNNLLTSRSNLGVYVSSDGGILEAYSEYGKQGADYISVADLI